MSFYYVTNSTGKIYASYGGDPFESPPDGYSIVTTLTDDRRMTWDFTNEVWFWDKQGLLLVSKDHYNAAMASLLNVGGAGVSISTPTYIATYLSALKEDPAATRSFSGDGISFSTRTNAQIIADFEAYFNGFQQTFDVGALVAADINSSTVVDPAGIASAWSTYSAAYMNTRTKLEDYSTLVATVAALA